MITVILSDNVAVPFCSMFNIKSRFIIENNIQCSSDIAAIGKYKS
jgi:hypothetical protein